MPQKLLALSFAVIGVLGVVTSIFLLLVPSDRLIDLLVRFFSLQSLESRLHNYLSPLKLHLLGVVMSLCSLILLGLFFRFPNVILRFIVSIIEEFRFVKNSPRLLWNWICTLPKWEQFGLFSIVLFLTIKGIYYICLFDLQYDEAWTYHQFIDRGPLFCIISPHNNHPIYSIASTLLGYFPFSLKWQLRLPVLLAGIASTVVFYPLLRKWFGGMTALFCLGMFVVSPVVTFYTMFGRGYIFGIFGMISLLLLLNRNAKNSTGIFTTSILMIYSLPSMLLPWLVIIIAALLAKKLEIKVAMASLICSAILYSPVLLSGASSEFTKSSNFGQFDLEKIYAYYLKVGHFLNGEPWIYLTFLVFGVWYFYSKKSIIYLLLLSLPILSVLLFGTQAPERIWSFLCVFQTILLGFVLQNLFVHFNSGSKKFMAFFALSPLLLVQFRISDQHDFLRWSEELDHNCKQASLEITSTDKPNKLIYNNFYYIQPILNAQFTFENKAAYSIETGMPASKDYRPFENKKAYSFVIVDIENPAQTNWQVPHDTLIWIKYFGLLRLSK